MTAAVSFGVIADCQYGDIDDTDISVLGTEHIYYNRNRLSPKKLREAVDTFNTQDLSFVIHLGDFTEKNLEGVDILQNITKGLQAPFWHVLGNHDYWGSEGDKQRVFDAYSMESSYYSRRHGGYRFIVLDTNEVGVIMHVSESPEWKKGRETIDRLKGAGAINAYDWNGGLGPEQLTWLETELQDAKSEDEKVVLFAHHPVFPPGALNMINENDFFDLIDKYDHITAFINGHNHCGAFGMRKNVPYVTVPGMVNGETNAFGVVHLTDDGEMDIHGYGRVQDMAISRSAS